VERGFWMGDYVAIKTFPGPCKLVEVERGKKSCDWHLHVARKALGLACQPLLTIEEASCLGQAVQALIEYTADLTKNGIVESIRSQDWPHLVQALQAAGTGTLNFKIFRKRFQEEREARII
jgi:hypothetical protein